MTVSSNFFHRAVALGAVSLTITACADDPCVDDGVSNEACDQQTGEGGIPAGGTTSSTGGAESSSSSSSASASASAGDSESGTGGEQIQYCRDFDRDGQGAAEDCQFSLIPIDGYVPNADDCDDADPQVFLGAAELEPEFCTADRDDDGYGDQNIAGSDCDDQHPAAFPGAAENEPDPTICAQDADGDGWGAIMPTGSDVTPGHDCDDDDPQATPKTASGQACLDPLEVDVGPDFNTRQGALFSLAAVAKGGTSLYTYDWAPADVIVAKAGTSNPTGRLDATTVINVVVRDQITGSSASDAVRVFVEDDPIDLEKMCPPVVFDVDHSTLLEPKWSFESEGTRACQRRNNWAAGLLCDFDYDEFVLRGEMGVDSNSGAPDDDWMGFVWGADDVLDEFYVFSWKRNDQTHDDCGDGNVYRGMRVKRIMADSGTLGCIDIAGHGSTDHSRALVTQDAFPGMTDQAWNVDTTYSFELTVTRERTHIRIAELGGQEIAAFDVVDEEEPLAATGKFGAFDFSQDFVCFDNFTVAAPQ